MLAKRIIPCLDVEKGRVVKGTKFLELVDAGDPVAVAARYEAEGADELVFLDITASHEGRAIMLEMVHQGRIEHFPAAFRWTCLAMICLNIVWSVSVLAARFAH